MLINLYAKNSQKALKYTEVPMHQPWQRNRLHFKWRCWKIETLRMRIPSGFSLNINECFCPKSVIHNSKIYFKGFQVLPLNNTKLPLFIFFFTKWYYSSKRIINAPLFNTKTQTVHSLYQSSMKSSFVYR